MRTLVLVFALVCGSCVVLHAQRPFTRTGYKQFYSHYRYPQRYTQHRFGYKQYGHRRYAQPYVKPRPYARPFRMRIR